MDERIWSRWSICATFFDYTRGNQQNSVPNRILANALDAASKYNRAIAVMYDLSGLKNPVKIVLQL